MAAMDAPWNQLHPQSRIFFYDLIFTNPVNFVLICQKVAPTLETSNCNIFPAIRETKFSHNGQKSNHSWRLTQPICKICVKCILWSVFMALENHQLQLFLATTGRNLLNVIESYIIFEYSAKSIYTLRMKWIWVISMQNHGGQQKLQPFG